MGRNEIRADITKEVLEQYIKMGVSQEKIATELETTQATISQKMKKYGIEPARTRTSKYDEKILIKQLQNGWSMEQIAKYFGVCTNTVTQWIRKNGLKKYRKAPSKKFDVKICRTCIYGTRKKTDLERCNYLSITGHSRNMGQPEEICSKYVKGGRSRGKRKI